MLSHFDSDHSAKTIEIIENIKVKNIIISKQAEKSNEFENIIKRVKQENINIIQVEAGNVIKIDKDTYFKILWPQNNNIIKMSLVQLIRNIFHLVF